MNISLAGGGVTGSEIQSPSLSKLTVRLPDNALVSIQSRYHGFKVYIVKYSKH